MQEEIIGSVMPVLEITLQPAESVLAVSGEFSWMTNSIQLSTSATGAGGGLWGAFKRLASGATFFMTKYTAENGPGKIAFAAKLPGTIVPLDVSPGNDFLVHRHGFLASTLGVEISLGFQRSLGTGIFGGEGFTLQRLGGQGRAWIELGGELMTYQLAPGEQLRVHPGHIGAFQESVQFDITTISGISNVLFGGTGLFVGVLTGPGQVWLQTMTMANLAHSLIPYLPSGGGEAAGLGAAALASKNPSLGSAAVGMGLGILGSELFGNNDQ